MARSKSAKPRGNTFRNRRLGTFERLEERCLLSPVLHAGTNVNGPITPQLEGFVSVRLISTVTGRIEADPTGAFGNDIFVISRGTINPLGGLLGGIIEDEPGTIYRVDPFGAGGAAFGLGSASSNVSVFAKLPVREGGLGFGGYTNWFDLAFDPSGSFDKINGQPTLFVSTVDISTTIDEQGVNPNNAVYAFTPDGELVSPIYAVATEDKVISIPGTLDNCPAVLAVAPNDMFGSNLYIMDARDDNPGGTSAPEGEGIVFWSVSPDLVATTGTPVLLDDVAKVTDHVDAIVPSPQDDLDPRALVFDPNRGIILGGMYGEPAFRLYGGMFVASTDLERTNLTRILWFPSLIDPPVDIFIAPAGAPIAGPDDATAVYLPGVDYIIGDMAFDPVGFFGGGICFTDYVSGGVWQLTVDATDPTVYSLTLFADNFDVASPPSPATDAQAAEVYEDAFSITFSPDGQYMYVSDRDGIWAFEGSTLQNTPAGSYYGLRDVRELRAPYTGSGFAAAIIDTGVDAAHLGFQGTVAPGYDPMIPGPANYNDDPSGHGTAVAGIVHQIVPDAVITPVMWRVTGPAREEYDALRYLRGNPFVDDPRTPQVERVPIVAANMSIAIRIAPEPDVWAVDNERHAFELARGLTISLKSLMQDLRHVHRYGLVPVAAAGNEGYTFNALSGTDFPAVLNEAVEVIAAYPFGPTPPLPAPPLTFDGLVRHILDPFDFVAFPGKIPSFSNRNIISDYAAPGMAVSTFAPSGYLGPVTGPADRSPALAPLEPQFDGTSAVAPFVTGAFVFGFDVIDTWVKVANRGGRLGPTDPVLSSLYGYLTRSIYVERSGQAGGVDRSFTGLLKLGPIPNLREYLNIDGINAILQWTAVPREDADLVGDDLVEQPRMIELPTSCPQWKAELRSRTCAAISYCLR